MEGNENLGGGLSQSQSVAATNAPKAAPVFDMGGTSPSSVGTGKDDLMRSFGVYPGGEKEAKASAPTGAATIGALGVSGTSTPAGRVAAKIGGDPKSTLAEQFRALVGEARKTVFGRTRRYGLPSDRILPNGTDGIVGGARDEGLRKDDIQVGQPDFSSGGGGDSTSGITGGKIGGMSARRAGVTEDEKNGGAVYMHRDTVVPIPKDVDLNDDAAVDAYVAEQNDIIDMMDGADSGNEEEVF